MNKYLAAPLLASALTTPSLAQFIGEGVWKTPVATAVFSMVHGSDVIQFGDPPAACSASTCTYTSMDFGTAPTAGNTRTAIVGWCYLPHVGGTLSSQVTATIDGTAATQLAPISNGMGCAHFYAPLSSGGSGATHTVTISFVGIQPPNFHYFTTWAAFNASSQDAQTDTTGAGPTHTYNYANYGVTTAVGGVFNIPVPSPTNLTTRQSTDVGACCATVTADNLSATGSVAFTINFSPAATQATGSFVAWKP